MTSHLFTIQFLFQPRILLSYFVKYFWAICNFLWACRWSELSNYSVKIILFCWSILLSNTSTCHAVPIKINWIPLLHHYTSRLHSSIKPQADPPFFISVLWRVKTQKKWIGIINQYDDQVSGDWLDKQLLENQELGHRQSLTVRLPESSYLGCDPFKDVGDENLEHRLSMMMYLLFPS